MPSGKRSRQQRQERLSAPPPVRSQGGRSLADRFGRRGLALGAAAAAAIVAAVVLAIVFATGGSSKPVAVDFAQIPNLQTGPPPWDNGSTTLRQKLSIVHLDALPAEGTVLHIHEHLDVYVNGKHVTMPAGIGIDDDSFITQIHSHEPDGIIHVESPTDHDFRLGQFFGEWGVRLTANCLGRYCGSLHWWVDGKRQTGNPADLVLRQHQEIAIAVGKPPAKVPGSFDFPIGL